MRSGQACIRAPTRGNKREAPEDDAGAGSAGSEGRRCAKAAWGPRVGRSVSIGPTGAVGQGEFFNVISAFSPKRALSAMFFAKNFSPICHPVVRPQRSLNFTYFYDTSDGRSAHSLSLHVSTRYTSQVRTGPVYTLIRGGRSLARAQPSWRQSEYYPQ